MDKFTIDMIRKRREEECFKYVDRSKFWYDELTDEQKLELKQWRQAWKDAPETGIIPEKLPWLDDKHDEKKVRVL